jgi:hypothetical protein
MKREGKTWNGITVMSSVTAVNKQQQKLIKNDAETQMR